MIGPEKAEGWLAKLYSALTGGQPLSHILGIQTLHPEALEAHYELYRTLMFGPSPLSRVGSGGDCRRRLRGERVLLLNSASRSGAPSDNP